MGLVTDRINDRERRDSERPRRFTAEEAERLVRRRLKFEGGATDGWIDWVCNEVRRALQEATE